VRVCTSTFGSNAGLPPEDEAEAGPIDSDVATRTVTALEIVRLINISAPPFIGAKMRIYIYTCLDIPMATKPFINQHH
jgi:hypothetical protein